MLKSEVKINVQGISKTEDGVSIVTFSATIETEKPKIIGAIENIVDHELYRKNKKMVNKDKEEYEDALFSLYDRVVSEKNGAKNE